MGKAAAKKGDKITGTDTHIIVLLGPVPGHRFEGPIEEELSDDVKIQGKEAAVVGSKAKNEPGHTPLGPGFAKGPKNEGEVTSGSDSVKINGKKAARDGDRATTCNDPPSPEAGQVKVEGRSTVKIGD